MPTPHNRPVTPRSRRLGRALRAARDKIGLTATEVAGRVHLSQTQITRIEGGGVRATPELVRKLMVDVYGYPVDEAEKLMALAQDLDSDGWWQPYKIHNRYLEYIGWEAEATDIHIWEPLLIPGLLQTPEYAQQILMTGWEERDGEVGPRWHARMERQTILRRPVPPKLWVVISEGALACRIGDARTTREQHRHLVEMAQLPNVRIQVVPFSAGVYVAGHNPFAVLYFRDDDPPLGAAEQLTGTWLTENASEIRRLEKVHADLVDQSLTQDESISRIESET